MDIYEAHANTHTNYRDTQLNTFNLLSYGMDLKTKAVVSKNEKKV